MKGYTKLGLFTVIAYFGLSILLPIHEYGHYVVGRLFGLDGTIAFDRVNFTSVPAGITPWQIILVKLAGGVISGAVLLALAAISQKPHGYGFLPVAIASFAYAPLDGLGLFSQAVFGIVLVGMTFTIVMLLANAGEFDDDVLVELAEAAP